LVEISTWAAAPQNLGTLADAVAVTGEEDIRDLCLAAARRITTEEQFDRALARVPHGA
jgi:hypothetical protein